MGADFLGPLAWGSERPVRRGARPALRRSAPPLALRLLAVAGLVRAPLAQAGDAAAKQSLEAVVARMTYWQEVPAGARATPAAKDERKYLVMEQDGAGMNNKRIGWEMAGVLALYSGRTLVLPPNDVWWAVDTNGTTSRTEDFINLDQLRGGLPVLTFREFAQREQQALSLPGWTVHEELEGQQKRDWVAFALANFTLPGKNHSEWCDVASYRSDAVVIYANHGTAGRLLECERWFELGQPSFTEAQRPWPVPNSAYSLLRNHFVWHKDVFELAAPIVRQLGLFQYVSIHARFNDFKEFEPEAVEPAEKIVSKWAETLSSEAALVQMPGRVVRRALPMSALEVSARRSRTRAQSTLHRIARWVKPGAALYISTDETDESFLQTFRDHGIDARWSRDFFERADSPIAHLVAKDPVRAKKLLGPVEQVVCAFSRTFLGTPKSTFSAYITRMRIYADAPQTGLKEETRLFHTMTPTPEMRAALEREISEWEARGGMAKVNKSSPGVF